MNWTGGRLQRHSKNSAKSTDLARQKQHFAAVRQRLQNGATPQGTPFRPSFLIRHGSDLGQGVTPFVQGSQSHTGHPKAKQKSLDDYSSTAPLAQRLSSMQRRSARSAEPLERRRQLPSGVHHHEAAGKDVSSTRSQTDAASNSSRHSGSRKRGHSKLGDEALLELSKKRLLMQTDWIGLTNSRPLQMSFTSRQDRDRIGKRRKIDSGIEQRQKLFGKLKDGNRAQPPFMSDALGVAPESISVRIGDRALSTQVSVPPHESVRPREVMDQVRQSSESMLFDVEQHELSRHQALGLTEDIVELENIEMNHVHEQDTSGSRTVPVCISDNTNTSEDSASTLHEQGTRQSEAVEAESDKDPGAQDERLNGKDNEDDHRGNDQEYGSINLAQGLHSESAPFRLVFESSSYHHDVLSSGSPLELCQRRKSHEHIADGPDRMSPLPDAVQADAAKPEYINIHATQAEDESDQGTDEAEPSEGNLRDDDLPWRKLFSIPSSTPGFVVDDFNREYISSGRRGLRSVSASLATTRDAGFQTLRPVESLFEAESSASINNSPSPSFRLITNLVAQPRRGKNILDEDMAKLSYEHNETKQRDPNEYWRKFVFDDEDEDERCEPEDEEEMEDDRTTAAQPAVSAWSSPSSNPKNRSISRRTHLSLSAPGPTQYTGTSIPQRLARAAALSMKNNLSNPSDDSSVAETDAPANSETRRRSGPSNQARKKGNGAFLIP
ncbi:hypothetical protein FKW77_004509 [Venturia effusa]|uniref:Uncharacterized protein n=1 Tax=Venturia effusa TaxID=50376 RepID=A0A517LK40_9PEZI|nr:hypothetical protein FKW77_004509 [Venturia effusa]